LFTVFDGCQAIRNNLELEMAIFTRKRFSGRTENMPDLADYMTTQEAADLLGYHVHHVRRMLREGDLEGQKVGYMWFVSKESVDIYRKEAAQFPSKFDPRLGNL
jgi:excisionase family DNA binding protein